MRVDFLPWQENRTVLFYVFLNLIPYIVIFNFLCVTMFETDYIKVEHISHS